MQRPLLPDLSARAVPARNANILIERSAAMGHERATLLRNTGIDETLLETPGARISYQNFINLLFNINELGIYPKIFLTSQDNFSIASYGMLGYAMMSSDTLRQALNIALKYYRTSGPLCEFSFHFRDSEVLIQADNSFYLGEDLLPLVIEDLFASFPPLLDRLLGEPLLPRRVEFSYPAPPHASEYKHHFACPVEFNAPTNRFVLDARALDLPLVQADADAALVFEESCRNLLLEIETHDSLANRMRKTLISSPGRLMSADEMAKYLNIGTRTLRRRLAREKTSYQKILDEVRARLASDYLKTTLLSNQEIAELLGYTEATNFRRAFIRWMGCSPGSYRKRPYAYRDSGFLNLRKLRQE